VAAAPRVLPASRTWARVSPASPALGGIFFPCAGIIHPRGGLEELFKRAEGVTACAAFLL